MKIPFPHRESAKQRRSTLRLACLFIVVYLPVIYVTTKADPLPKMPIVPPVQILTGDGKPMTRVVSTKYGSLRGFVTYVSTKPLKPVEVFLGVPYASPPVSSLRFMPPVTPAHWKGIRTANRFSPVCPQRPPDIKNETEALKFMPLGRLQFLKRLIPYLDNQSEDCLYLNIYAPPQQTYILHTSSKKENTTTTTTVRAGKPIPKVPVLVFIHGESYEWNAGNPYDGSVLASFGNVVVVTVNFRLGVLGFLPATEGSARGNYGLTDQVAALHWIQENIAEFGGDPKNVTLFGHGHGAACVNFLVLSPMAKVSTLFPAGLFHRAIMMSGSALSPWAIAHDAAMYAQQVARTLGCPSIQSASLLECMRERSIADILRVKLSVPKFLSGFGPIVDGIVIQNDPLILMEELKDEHQYGIFDLMFGVTRVESYYHINAHEEKYGIDADRRDKLLRTLVRNIFNFHLQEIFLTIVNEYTDWTKSTQHAVNILDGTLDALGDALVVAPSLKSASYHSEGPRRSYFYVFSYQSDYGEFPQRQGCVQGEDLQFVFGAPLIGKLGPFERPYNKSESTLSEAVMTYWVNFARNGDPNTPQQELETSVDRPKGRFDKVVWSTYENQYQKYLQIGAKPKSRDHYHAHRLSFWLHLFPQLHLSNSANISPEHHLLDDHDNMQSYDGVVRQLSYFMTSLPNDNQVSTPDSSRPSSTSAWRGPKKNIILSTIMPTYKPVNDKAVLATTTVNITDSLAVIMQPGNYSAALSVTIAVGCSLLVLNVLIFAGIYFQRDRSRSEAAAQKRAYGDSVEGGPMDPCSTPQGKQLTLRAPPPSPVCSTIPQELPLHPPLPQLHLHHHPHKVLSKPCSVPMPPQIPQRESLAEEQPLLKQGGGIAPGVYSQCAQVHRPPSHAEINL